MAEIGIGTTVYLLGEYASRSSEGINTVITGQTDRSWIFKDSHFHWASEVKFPKRADKNGERWTAVQHNGRLQVFFTPDELRTTANERERKEQEACWIGCNAYRLGQEVGRCKDIATLRQIAALVGYTPEEQK